ncbi:MAG: hypothetical protein PHP69_03215 [Candidatus Omnitrophica bacterium]|jgi:type II secretory pathway component PulM|nr:hypothetical protein [Candidatus Omnitrophota bacterium]MDD5081233.1 hypothetical protein [Candidatus Omnitrophota bacterium]
MLKAFFSGLSDKEKKILYIAMSFVFLAMLDRLIFSPIADLSRNIEDRISSQTDSIKKNFAVLRYKNKILQEEEEYSIFFISDESTHEELVAEFLSDVESLAQKSGIQLTNINPVNVQENTDSLQYDLLLECNGEMNKLVDFVYSIDASDKPIRVVACQLIPKDRREYSVKAMITVVKILVYPYGKERTIIPEEIQAE